MYEEESTDDDDILLRKRRICYDQQYLGYSLQGRQTLGELENLNCEEIASFLAKNGFENIAEKFLEHQISGRYFSRIDQQYLLSMGVPVSGIIEFLEFHETLKKSFKLKEKESNQDSLIVISEMEGTNKEVAIKTRHQNYEVYKNEIHCLTQLRSRYVVSMISEHCYNKGETNIIIMERGNTNLEEVMLSSQDTMIEPYEMRYILRSIFRAVGYIHSQGYVHGSLTPANLLEFSTEGNVSRWKLVGFDSAGKIGTPVTSYHPKYCSPEVARHIFYPTYFPPPLLTEAIDVWALGIMTLELFIGHNYFNNLQKERILEGLASDEPMIPNLETTDKIANSFFSKILAKDPEKGAPLKELMMDTFITG
ncbi:ovarian-specific serine/threonine-protein kinase lok [Anaeramoeba flamelloides]|uniref:Ovarian-specific serine/threonine-protein kinase lok n=1 Tax=Anaeramoeba flamelloides TaxID=1746091 RepID=A0AAV7YWZ4_9EUKA|nr:ovarian-specific serine/threonine-protein kinase lok [Anaeramoeba flamelloides]